MVRVDYDVRIDRPAEEVFDYITQVERFADWQRDAGIESARRLDDRPIGPGARFELQRRSRGQVATIRCEVTEFERPTRFTFHGEDNDGFVSDFATTLVPAGAATDLHWSVRMQPPTLLYRLLQPLIRREILKSARVDFVNLKAALEGGGRA